MRKCPECGALIRKTHKVHLPRHGVDWELGRCPACGGAWKWRLMSAEEVVHRLFVDAFQDPPGASDTPPGWPEELSFTPAEAEALERRGRPTRNGKL